MCDPGSRASDWAFGNTSLPRHFIERFYIMREISHEQTYIFSAPDSGAAFRLRKPGGGNRPLRRASPGDGLTRAGRSHTNVCTRTYARAYGGSNICAHAYSGTCTHADASTNTGADACTDAHTFANTNAGADACTDAPTHAYADAQAHAYPYT